MTGEFDTKRERFYDFFRSLSEDVKMSVVWGIVILLFLVAILTTVVVYNAVDEPKPSRTVEQIVCSEAARNHDDEMMNLCRDLSG